MKVLFLYLKAFSFTGGIEKFNRSLLKALHELSIDGLMDADAISAYDSKPDEKYFPALRFMGHGGVRPLFVLNALYQAMKYDTIILGHVNLAIVGALIKALKPSVRLIVIAHGIEVWYTLTGIKKRLMEQADVILSVSDFTKGKILEFNPSVLSDKIRIFPNTIDTYFAPPSRFEKPKYLIDRYKLKPDQKVLLTITRLADSEKYKGYDNVIASIPSIREKVPDLCYLIGGKADPAERKRVEKLIEDHGVCDSVRLLGFISDSELIDHYLLADVFVLQSRKEGFGIVFIEALACGRKVIAGSKDGSVEALMHGELGKLVDPDDQKGLIEAIITFLQSGGYSPITLQRKVYQAFGFHRYKNRLKEYLTYPCPDRMLPMVVICYDHYLPDFTAGGPVASIHHLTRLCGDRFDFRVVTSNRIFQSGMRMTVAADSWVESDGCKVWYASKPSSVLWALHAVADRKPIIWFNGLFSVGYFLSPLKKVVKLKLRFIISPRGMIQPGALRKGRVKKFLYLSSLRFMGWLRKGHWHATDQQELNDVKKLFGIVPCTMIPNVPVIPAGTDVKPSKTRGLLQLVYYSLISEKKNLLFLLKLLQEQKLSGVRLKIIGPVKDQTYWDSCLKVIESLPAGMVEWQGAVDPERGLELIRQSHAFVLPTLGENFGHAIVEALGAGRPVLISEHTPWTDVGERQAGQSISLKREIWISQLVEMLDWSDQDFQRACGAAQCYYAEKFNFAELKEQYTALLNSIIHDHPGT